MLLQISRAVIPRRYQKILRAILHLLTHLHFNAPNQRRLTHGLYDSGSPQNRNASLNSKPWIKRSGRRLRPVRHAHRHEKTSIITRRIADFFQFFLYHGSGYFINRRAPHRLLQSLFRNPAYALSSVNADTRRIPFFNLYIDFQPVRPVRVVSRILLDGTGNPILSSRHMQDFQIQRNPFRRHKLRIPTALVQQKHPARRLCRPGRTRPGRIAKPHFLIIFNAVIPFQTCMLPGHWAPPPLLHSAACHKSFPLPT